MEKLFTRTATNGTVALTHRDDVVDIHMEGTYLGSLSILDLTDFVNNRLCTLGDFFKAHNMVFETAGMERRVTTAMKSRSL